METALTIPLASLILGGVGLMYTVRSGLTRLEREELVALRKSDQEKNNTIRELRDENVYLMRRLAQMPNTPERPA